MGRRRGRGAAVSIRWQLSTVTLVTVLAVFGVGLWLLSSRDLEELRAEGVSDAVLVARLVAESSAGEVAFSAPDAAAEILSHLSVDPEVESAALYDEEGRLFASYVRPGSAQPPPSLASPLPAPTVNVHEQRSVVLEEVGYKGERFGTVRLAADDATAVAQAREHRLAFLGMGVLLVVLAMAISGVLQRVVSGPVLSLAALAERISVKRDWSERAEPGGSLEIDALARGFNMLLATIAAHEAEQRRYLQRLQLLQEVDRAILAARTPEEVAEMVTARLVSLFDCRSVGVLERGRGAAPPRVLAHAPPALDAFLREAQAPDPDGLLHVPLRAAGRTLGCLVCIAAPGSRFATEDVELAQALADSVSVSLRQSALAGEIARHTIELEERVSERTRELTAAIEELEGFTYSVAHDLRAPLRAIAGYASLVLSEGGPCYEGPAGDYLRRIGAAAQRMDRLIIDLLEYSRLSRGTLDVSPVPLDDVVGDARALLSGALKERGARLSVARPLGMVLGNRTTLVQVVANLIDNATKFTPKGTPPVVRLWTETHPGGTARLCVEDEGIGIPPEYQADLFQVFHRLHSETAYPGTGIGLAIVKRAVERMGGSVGVVSAPGHGSRFWVDLPAVALVEADA